MVTLLSLLLIPDTKSNANVLYLLEASAYGLAVILYFLLY